MTDNLKIKLFSINEAVSFITKKIKPEKIILFGSYANGNYNDESDIDLFIIKDIPKEEVRDMRIAIRYLLNDLQLKNKISFDIHVDSQERIDYRIKVINDQFYQDIFTNGKVLYAQ
jgi:uncharacterized protein